MPIAILIIVIFCFFLFGFIMYSSGYDGNGEQIFGVGMIIVAIVLSVWIIIASNRPWNVSEESMKLYTVNNTQYIQTKSGRMINMNNACGKMLDEKKPLTIKTYSSILGIDFMVSDEYAQ